MSLINQICLISLTAKDFWNFLSIQLRFTSKLLNHYGNRVWRGLCQAQAASGNHLKLVKGRWCYSFLPHHVWSQFLPRRNCLKPTLGKMKAKAGMWTGPNSPGG